MLFNWEFPIGEKINPKPRSSGLRFLAHPRAVDALRDWSPGFATLATNHALDAGPDGLRETMLALRQAGFTTLGAGRTHEEAAQAAFWGTSEGRLAIVNWVFPETHPDWMCVPGPNCWPGRDQASLIIRHLRDMADWVLVIVHWSDELFPYPRPEDRATARELAQMGADLVVGHHPHVVRGMEIVGRCPVFYSLGDFYFSEAADGHAYGRAPRNREGLGLQIAFTRGQKPSWQVLSFWEEEHQAISDPFRRAAKRMVWASHPLHRFGAAPYAGWYQARRARFDRWGYRWHFRMWELGWRGLFRHATGLFRSPLRVRPGVR